MHVAVRGGLTGGYSWRVQLFKFPDLPFISPFLRTRPETYSTSGPEQAIPQRLRGKH